MKIIIDVVVMLILAFFMISAYYTKKWDASDTFVAIVFVIGLIATIITVLDSIRKL